MLLIISHWPCLRPVAGSSWQVFAGVCTVCLGNRRLEIIGGRSHAQEHEGMFGKVLDGLTKGYAYVVTAIHTSKEKLTGLALAAEYLLRRCQYTYSGRFLVPLGPFA